MTSLPWRPGDLYGDHESPKYNALSYTWGRWSLDDIALKSIESIEITGVSWPIPRIDPDHFTVKEFMNVIRLSSINAGKVEKPGEQATKSPCDFLWCYNLDLGTDKHAKIKHAKRWPKRPKGQEALGHQGLMGQGDQEAQRVGPPGSLGPRQES
jgi:hypothetical protein